MRKKKWKKILIWAASIIVVLGVGGLFAANYAVDKVISTLSADLESDLLIDEAVVTDTDSEKQNTNHAVEVDSSSSVDKEVGITSSDGSTDKTVEVSTNMTDSGSNESKEQDKSEESYSAEVSTDKAKNLQEKITVSEKAQVTSVLLKELSISDIKELQALASGGLNLEEKKQARSIILDKLSAEQYDELIQVAKKYGMSQGKSYKEVIKEK